MDEPMMFGSKKRNDASLGVIQVLQRGQNDRGLSSLGPGNFRIECQETSAWATVAGTLGLSDSGLPALFGLPMGFAHRTGRG